MKSTYQTPKHNKVRAKAQKTGEIFTPPELVKSMVDEADASITIDSTFLEPTCGDGQFLVEILKRKLKLCKPLDEEEIVKVYTLSNINQIMWSLQEIVC